MGELFEDRAFAAGLLEALRQPLLVLDGALLVEAGNRAFQRTFRIPPESLCGAPLHLLGGGLFPQHLVDLARALSRDGREFEAFELTIDDVATSEPRVFLVEGRTVHRAQDAPCC